MPEPRYGRPFRTAQPGPPVALVLAIGIAFLLTQPVGVFGVAGASSNPVPYDLPRSAFNITDHNLTYGTNMVRLAAPIEGSFELDVRNNLVANTSQAPDRTEAQIGIGPLPAGAEETNITPLFILQQAASGLLRIEYVPFAMNDTYGFIVYEGFPVPSAPGAFVGRELTLTFDATAPPVPAYAVTVPYGYANGNVTVTLGGIVLVAHYPVAWANFGAFYAYGLTTAGFASGSLNATVTTLPTHAASPSSSSDGSIGVVPLWVLSAAIGAVVAGTAVAVIGRRRAGEK